MITKKVFFKTVAAFLILCVLFGAVLPFLVSANSPVAVGIALLVMIAIPVGAVYYVLFPNKEEK